MKLFQHTLMVAACAAMVAVAGAEMKVATVDMQKLFKDYYKTHDQQKEIDLAKAEVQEKNTERLKRIEAIQTELQDKAKKIEDPSLGEKARKDLADEFNVLKNEMSALDQERRSFIERKTRALQDQMGRAMKVLLDDVNAVVESLAKEGKYDFVYDKSAIGASQTRPILYSNEKYDITAQAMEKLNAGAPAGFDPNAATPTDGQLSPTPTGGQAPAPAPAVN